MSGRNADAPAATGAGDEAPVLSKCVQFAYVTSDLGQAKAMFQNIFGVERWLDIASIGDRETMVIEGRDGTRIEIRAAIAYVGDVQFELIEPISDPARIYLDYLRNDGSFEMCPHHLGFRQERPDQVRALEARLAVDHAIPLATDSDRTPVFYADARARLGHHLEYFSLPEDFDRLIPRN